MRAQDLMNHPAITCRGNDDLTVPSNLMWEHDCGMVTVVRDDGRLVGVITDRDIAMAASTQGRALSEIYVASAMARHVVSATPDQRIGDVERLMVANQVRRIPIVDADAKPIGVLSLNDLANEAVQPDTQMKDAFSNIAHTLAAICRPRSEIQQAA
jgi:CBS domain-containing protein